MERRARVRINVTWILVMNHFIVVILLLLKHYLSLIFPPAFTLNNEMCEDKTTELESLDTDLFHGN